MLPHIIVITDTTKAAFKHDPDTGELIETIEFRDGTPNWDHSGPCDPERGENPRLQTALHAALGAL